MAELPSLPKEYLTFLETHDGAKSYIFDDLDSWWLDTKTELLKVINVDGRRLQAIYQLKSFSESLKEHVDDDATEDENGEPFPLARLAQGLAIGNNNGDILFLDPTDHYSAWIYHHDGFDVEKLASSFAEWLATAKLDKD
jgi:SMI1 / KNR4 family (SUKH-1)